MSEPELARQLGAAVRAALAPAAEYLALVVRNNPRASAGAFLGRPDVSAVLTDAISEAMDAAMAAADQAWSSTGAPPSFIYTRLMADIPRAYDGEALRRQILAAHASVAEETFTPGVHAPGEHPAARAAERRAAAVSGAVLAWGRKAALRNQMTVSTAEGTGAATATLQDALGREQASGARLLKTWKARPGCCFWCRRLNGVTIGLRDSFASYLGGPAVLHSGPHRRVATPAGEQKFRAPAGSMIVYTQPPRLYHGDLQGPLLHPFCHCKLGILRAGGHQPAVPLSRGQEGFADDGPPPRQDFPPARSLAASDIWGMPEDRYQALLALLHAGASELGAVLNRLAEGSADRPDPAVLRRQHSVLRSGVHRTAGVRTRAPGGRVRIRVRPA